MITFEIIILIENFNNKKVMNSLCKTEKKVEDRKFQQNGIHHKNIFEKEKKKQIKKKKTGLAPVEVNSFKTEKLMHVIH